MWRIELPGGGEIKTDSPDKTVSDTSNTVNRELSNAGNSINSGLNQATGGASFEDAALNFITGGLLGFNDGQISPGFVTRGLTEGVGELTGANALRAANNQTRDLIAQQRAEAERLRQEEIARMRNREISASRAAGAQQTSAFLGAGGSTSSDSMAFNNLTRDFLGL